MNAELLYEALSDGTSLEQLNRQELEKLVSMYPYFSIGQLLLAKKQRSENQSESYQRQREHLQTFYRNPWWLFYQLELNDQQVKPKRNGAQEFRGIWPSLDEEAPTAPVEAVAPVDEAASNDHLYASSESIEPYAPKPSIEPVNVEDTVHSIDETYSPSRGIAPGLGSKPEGINTVAAQGSSEPYMPWSNEEEEEEIPTLVGLHADHASIEVVQPQEPEEPAFLGEEPIDEETPVLDEESDTVEEPTVVEATAVQEPAPIMEAATVEASSAIEEAAAVGAFTAVETPLSAEVGALGDHIPVMLTSAELPSQVCEEEAQEDQAQAALKEMQISSGQELTQKELEEFDPLVLPYMITSAMPYQDDPKGQELVEHHPASDAYDIEVAPSEGRYGAPIDEPAVTEIELTPEEPHTDKAQVEHELITDEHAESEQIDSEHAKSESITDEHAESELADEASLVELKHEHAEVEAAYEAQVEHEHAEVVANNNEHAESQKIDNEDAKSEANDNEQAQPAPSTKEGRQPEEYPLDPEDEDKQEEVEAPWTAESEPPSPRFSISMTPLNQDFAFEPLHTVDYFASQGIRAEDVVGEGSDKFSRNLKSFTEWLRTMKRINPLDRLHDELDTATEAEILHLAAGANHQKEAIVTESMAQVWVHQGKILKAIEVYNKLSLQHPEKRAYFAAKIEQLNRL